MRTRPNPIASSRTASRLRFLAILPLFVACEGADRSTGPDPDPHIAPQFTMGSGTTRTFLGRGTFETFNKVKRTQDDWEVELEADGGLEVLVQSFDYAPGAQTGWHAHPGPVMILVAQGTLTFYEADDPDCRPTVVHAGQGYVDRGTGHIGRNLSGAPAKDFTVFLAPPGTAPEQLRIDVPAQPQCPF